MKTIKTLMFIVLGMVIFTSCTSKSGQRRMQNDMIANEVAIKETVHEFRGKSLADRTTFLVICDASKDVYQVGDTVWVDLDSHQIIGQSPSVEPWAPGAGRYIIHQRK